MALDFTKVVTQVKHLGRTMARQNTTLGQRVDVAQEQFDKLPDNRTIMDRVKLARIKDAGYRGIAPLDGSREPINAVFSLPQIPERATVIAADGSQIYPDQHSAAFYFLINVGLFTYYHGVERLPDQFSDPQLFFRMEDTHDNIGNPIKNAVVNARRTVREMQSLAGVVWDHRPADHAVVAMYDGPLLFFLGKDVVDAGTLEREYDRSLIRIHDTHHTMEAEGTGGSTSLIGYVDRPTSRFLIAMMHLLELDERAVTRRALETMGQYEGLTDSWLFRKILAPAQRSALMIQQSPQNKRFRNEIGDNFEIAFFYLNVSKYADDPYIARIEMPMWVAHNPSLVDMVHGLVISQCNIIGNYPYALTRADELAVIRGAEKSALEDIIRTELLKNNQPFDESSKLVGKHQTRTDRRRFGDPVKPAF
ncbi:MAG: DNA double-strand break repair nuclease NurA [Chloroflexi bacterium]|nr:DNA double-strand break repair nuclease NurA [Chloroflexota bacterium]